MSGAGGDSLRVPPGTSPASWLVTRRQLDELERFLPLVRGRLLDVGCGRFPHHGALCGRVEEYAALEHPAGWLLAEKRQVPDGVKFVWADAEAIPFPTGRFDTVLMLEVIEHTPHPWRVWSELARVMRPGGYLFVSCPFQYPVHGEPMDFQRFTAHGLTRMAEEAGFEVHWVRPKGGLISLWIDLQSKPMLWIFRRLHLPTFWIGWVQRALCAVFRRESVAASRYTLGLCMAARRR